MNIIFFGNADFGSETLLSLIDSNNQNPRDKLEKKNTIL